ncbi:MAG: DUF3137 domain-containing protein [Saprospiraceae bacterium]
MQRLHEFRLFYNHTIHPELLRMERKRKRLLLLLFGSIIFLIGVTILDIYVDILVVTLFFLVFIIFYISFILYQIRQFVITFKPNIVNLILDFIDNEINYGKMTYEPKKLIPKSTFLSSLIFATPAPFYKGEDFIQGSYREMTFELCELNVREYSKVRNKSNYIFKGVFFQGNFNSKAHSPKSKIIALPREFSQYQSRTIKELNRIGCRIAEDIVSRNFRETFIIMASKNANVNHILSNEMQKAILNYKEKTAKEIYVSFIGSQMFIAVTEPKDLLEPHIFQSNVSFELVREFFEDLQLLLSVLEDLDVNMD